jgi:hypothetical protein
MHHPGRVRSGRSRLVELVVRRNFDLQAVELGLVDRAGVQQLLGLGDLVGRGGGGVTGGDRSDVAFELLLGLLLMGRGPLGHPLAPGDDIDQHGQEGQEHPEDHPQGLHPARQRVVAEQVGEDVDQDHDPDEQEEEPQHRPEDVDERDVGDDQGLLLARWLR